MNIKEGSYLLHKKIKTPCKVIKVANDEVKVLYITIGVEKTYPLKKALECLTDCKVSILQSMGSHLGKMVGDAAIGLADHTDQDIQSFKDYIYEFRNQED